MSNLLIIFETMCLDSGIARAFGTQENFKKANKILKMESQVFKIFFLFVVFSFISQ